VRTISSVADEDIEEFPVTTIQEQYTEIVKQAQDATLAAFDIWTRTVQDAFAQVPTVPVPFDAHQVIDQVYDFAGTLLAAQRDVAKKLVDTALRPAGNQAGNGATETAAA
jgi:hypothetical protein